MSYDTLRHIEYHGIIYSVCVNENRDEFSKKPCTFCGKAACESDHDFHCETVPEIVEMYDENGVDTSQRSAAYRQAKQELGIGKSSVTCLACYAVDIDDFDE